MTLFLQYLISGIQVGSIYALVALGLVLLYRTSRVLNFAHGQMALVAAFVAFSLVSSLGWPLWLGLLASLGASGALAALFYVLFVRRAKAASPLGLLILTVGFALLANGLISVIWGASSKSPPSLVPVTDTWRVGELVISRLAGVTAGVGLALMAALWLFIGRSRVGLAMRAVSQNPEVARTLGIPVPYILASTWAIAAMLGAAGALLFAPTTALTPNLMVDPLNKAFAAAILGGISSLPGAVLGGYVLGIAETLVGGYISLQFKLTLAFVILIVVLIFRPHGLLGEPERRRV